MKHSDAMSFWANLAELARDVGEPYFTVRAWKLRGSIPAAKYPKFVMAAAKRGYPVTYEALSLGAEQAAEDKREGKGRQAARKGAA